MRNNVSDQSAATGGPATPPDATAARLHPMVRRHRSSAVARATAARRDGGYPTALGTRRQGFFRRAPSNGGLRSQPTVARMACFGVTTRTFCRFRECDSGQTRPKPTIMGNEGSGQRMFCRHGGACLRRAMFSTRNASPESAAQPPRCLSAWSGVQATLPPLPICTSSAAGDRVP